MSVGFHAFSNYDGPLLRNHSSLRPPQLRLAAFLSILHPSFPQVFAGPSVNHIIRLTFLLTPQIYSCFFKQTSRACSEDHNRLKRHSFQQISPESFEGKKYNKPTLWKFPCVPYACGARARRFIFGEVPNYPERRPSRQRSLENWGVRHLVCCRVPATKSCPKFSWETSASHLAAGDDWRRFAQLAIAPHFARVCTVTGRNSRSKIANKKGEWRVQTVTLTEGISTLWKGIRT